MARPVGSPSTIGVARLYIPEDWVFRSNRHKYVFIDALSPKVRQLSFSHRCSFKLYQRFHQSLTRGLYNQRTLYGLRAIDIDQPQKEGIAVSVRLEIIVGEGEDSYEQVWTS
jgi:hypothetical protein